MKNIQLLALGVLALFLLGGCGGDSSNFVDEQSDNSQGQQEQQEQENNEAVNRVVNNLLEATADGSPAVFNYAPVPDSYGEGDYGAGTEEVNFVKYITSKDLDENGEFVKAINLEKDCGYIVKYSHSGRDLGSVALNLRITTPDEWERTMYLDFSGMGAADKTVSKEIYPNTVETIDGLSEEEIAELLAEGDMTREELAEEIALDNLSDDDIPQPLYIPASLDIVPEENPCAVFYTFKAPMSGLYKFAFRETVAGRPSSLDVPLEVRVYRAEESYSAGDDEEVKLTPRQIVDIQRILLNSATEFNEYGLPVAFGNSDDKVEDSVINSSVPSMIDSVKGIMAEAMKDLSNEIGKMDVKPDAYVNNIPYDENIFEDGAGFYAHNGMRSVIDSAINDDQYSENAVEEEYRETGHGTYGPADSIRLSTTQTFKADLISTEEEHDRAMDVSSTNSVTLLSQALGFSGRADDIALGAPGTKTVHIVYELAETSARPYNAPYHYGFHFKLKDGALAVLKSDKERFRRLFGDYFVAGYKWGLRFEATINITSYVGSNYIPELYDTQVIANEFAEKMKKMFERYQYAASSRTSNSDAEALKNEILRAQQYGTIGISIKNVNYSGTSTGGGSVNLQGLINDFCNFVSKAKWSSSKNDYVPLYVRLMRYREIREAKPYIDEQIPLTNETYNKIRNLMLKVYRTRCFYNTISLIPESHVRNRSLRSWTDRFSSLVDEMQGKLNRICADNTQLDQYINSFNSVYDDYKALLERYVFYRFFMQARQENGLPQGDIWHNSDAKYDVHRWYGFQNYDKSKIVQDDLSRNSKYYEDEHEEPCTKGPGYAHFFHSWDNDANGRYAINYLYTGCRNTNKSSARSLKGKNTIGTNGFNIYYQGEASRRLQVLVNCYAVYLEWSKYPFVGLED